MDKCSRCGKDIETWWHNSKRIAARLGFDVCRKCHLELSRSADESRKQFDKNRASLIAENEHLKLTSCSKCGSTKNLHIDHVKPLIQGGKNEASNMCVLCAKCNLKKGGRNG